MGFGMSHWTTICWNTINFSRTEEPSSLKFRNLESLHTNISLEANHTTYQAWQRSISWKNHETLPAFMMKSASPRTKNHLLRVLSWPLYSWMNCKVKVFKAMELLELWVQNQERLTMLLDETREIPEHNITEPFQMSIYINLWVEGVRHSYWLTFAIVVTVRRLPFGDKRSLAY